VKSKAAIGNHPIHPALVVLPIGAFFLALVGDTAHTITALDFWYRFSEVCLGVGVLTGLAAAIAGFVDYFGVDMGAAAGRLATRHMLINVTGIVLYGINFLLRRNDAALHTPRWPLVFGLEILTFAALGVSGWLGGELVFEHRVGVVEPAQHFQKPPASGRRSRRTVKAS
jgi:uncharacterized membrane protein